MHPPSTTNWQHPWRKVHCGSFGIQVGDWEASVDYETSEECVEKAASHLGGCLAEYISGCRNRSSSVPWRLCHSSVSLGSVTSARWQEILEESRPLVHQVTGTQSSLPAVQSEVAGKPALVSPRSPLTEPPAIASPNRTQQRALWHRGPAGDTSSILKEPYTQWWLVTATLGWPARETRSPATDILILPCLGRF